VSEENVAIVRGAYERFNEGDLEGFLGLLADDVEWVEMPGPYPPPAGGGAHRGRDTLARDVLSTLPENWETMSAEPEEFIDGGDHVVVTMHFRGRTTAGNDVHAPGVQVWSVRDGQLARMQNYTDTAQLARALGAS
jgi:uncharacterized protein